MHNVNKIARRHPRVPYPSCPVWAYKDAKARGRIEEVEGRIGLSCPPLSATSGRPHWNEAHSLLNMCDSFCEYDDVMPLMLSREFHAFSACQNSAAERLRLCGVPNLSDCIFNGSRSMPPVGSGLLSGSCGMGPSSAPEASLLAEAAGDPVSASALLDAYQLPLSVLFHAAPDSAAVGLATRSTAVDLEPKTEDMVMERSDHSCAAGQGEGKRSEPINIVGKADVRSAFGTALSDPGCSSARGLLSASCDSSQTERTGLAIGSLPNFGVGLPERSFVRLPSRTSTATCSPEDALLSAAAETTRPPTGLVSTKPREPLEPLSSPVDCKTLSAPKHRYETQLITRMERPDGTFKEVDPERAAQLYRYRQKRMLRLKALAEGQKKIRYECRKVLADTRPRVKGRFAKVGSAKDLDLVEENPAEEEKSSYIGESRSHPDLSQLSMEQTSSYSNIQYPSVPVPTFSLTGMQTMFLQNGYATQQFSYHPPGSLESEGQVEATEDSMSSSHTLDQLYTGTFYNTPLSRGHVSHSAYDGFLA